MNTFPLNSPSSGAGAELPERTLRAVEYLDHDDPELRLKGIQLLAEATPFARMTVLFRAANLAWDKKELSTAQRRFEEALAVSRSFGPHESAADILLCLAQVDRELGDNDRAELRFQEALALTKQLKDRDRELSVLIAFGTALGRMSRTDEAVATALRAAEIAAHENYDEHRAGALYNAGNWLFEAEQYERALPLLDEAVALFRKVGDRVFERSALDYLAAAYGNLGRLEDALKAARAQVDAARELGDEETLIWALLCRRRAARYQWLDYEEFESALEAAVLANRGESPYLQQALYHTAHAARRLKNFELSAKLLGAAEQAARNDEAAMADLTEWNVDGLVRGLRKGISRYGLATARRVGQQQPIEKTLAEAETLRS